MSLMRLRLARDALQFGNEDGYRALKDQYLILWHIRIDRTSGRACILCSPPSEPRVEFSINDGEFAIRQFEQERRSGEKVGSMKGMWKFGNRTPMTPRSASEVRTRPRLS